MNKIWFTADTHFNHAKIIEFCKRPYQDIWDMNEDLIKRWNDLISPKDLIYVLGDFSFGNNQTKNRIVEQLNGTIHLVPGCHDGGKKPDRMIVLDSIFILEVEPKPIVLCHYAMLVWPLKHYGAIHLFGHSHGSLPRRENCMDVGVDTNDYYPYDLEKIYSTIILHSM
jgi:calcineurin-like phosphoesterase family protein